MDPLIDYVFGPGDGTLSRWSSATDLDLDADGTPDAVSIDFDGDGRADDAMWDVDGDGHADVAALDIDDDGRPERQYRDSGRGLWDVAVGQGVTAGQGDAAVPGELPRGQSGDATGEEGSERLPGPTPRAGRQPSTQRLDLDGDGRVDAEVVDAGAGDSEAVEPGAAGSGAERRLYVDSDGDGNFDTVLVDSDGDRVADAAYGADAPEFGR